MRLIHLACSIPLLTLAAQLTAPLRAQPAVTFQGDTMRLRSASVTPGTAGSWNIGLVVENDNADGSLPSSFRRWWHCEIGNLATGGELLRVTVSNVGYSDVILPVWSISTDGGATFGDYTRVPTSAVPQVTSGGSVHSFVLPTPVGANAIRLAKYFPYTVADKDAFVASLAGHPTGYVRSIRNLGNSWQGRPIELVELSDPTIPDTHKRRIWIHSAVHPAETTAYYTVEGLIDFLLSGDPDAQILLENAILDIVPMANPDGVFLGNYRTNSRSVNLEEQWAAPYASAEREIVALRSEVERLMGTPSAPAANPIEVVFNLHSSHGEGFPFHFLHTANPNFDLLSNRSGVLPSVNALEAAWIQAYEARSPFVARGDTGSSSCGAPVRPFIECMMHDRWSSVPAWTQAGQRQVMAITFEGTYRRGPDGITWNTPDDYRLTGEEMGRALVDWFGFQPVSLRASRSTFGSSCGGLILGATITHTPPTNNVANLLAFGAAPGSIGTLLLALDPSVTPLPSPWNCGILGFVGSAPLVLTQPTTQLSLTIPPVPGLFVDLQVLAGVLDLASGTLTVQTSNGVELRNDF